MVKSPVALAVTVSRPTFGKAVSEIVTLEFGAAVPASVTLLPLPVCVAPVSATDGNTTGAGVG